MVVTALNKTGVVIMGGQGKGKGKRAHSPQPNPNPTLNPKATSFSPRKLFRPLEGQGGDEGGGSGQGDGKYHGGTSPRKRGPPAQFSYHVPTVLGVGWEPPWPGGVAVPAAASVSASVSPGAGSGAKPASKGQKKKRRKAKQAQAKQEAQARAQGQEGAAAVAVEVAAAARCRVAVPYEDGTAVFVSIGGWDGQGDAGTADDILGQLQTDLGYALALGLEECTGEEGGLLLHNRAKRKLTWDFEAAWTGAGWVVPGVFA